MLCLIISETLGIIIVFLFLKKILFEKSVNTVISTLSFLIILWVKLFSVVFLLTNEDVEIKLLQLMIVVAVHCLPGFFVQLDMTGSYSYFMLVIDSIIDQTSVLINTAVYRELSTWIAIKQIYQKY